MSRIQYKTDEEIEIIRENCLLVSKTLAMVAGELKAGQTGNSLDKKAEEFIRDHRAEPGRERDTGAVLFRLAGKIRRAAARRPDCPPPGFLPDAQ